MSVVYVAVSLTLFDLGAEASLLQGRVVLVVLNEPSAGCWCLGVDDVGTRTHVAGAFPLDRLFLKARLLRSKFLLVVRQVLRLLLFGVEGSVV